MENAARVGPNEAKEKSIVYILFGMVA